MDNRRSSGRTVALYAELVSSGRRTMAYLAADENLLLVLEQSFHALMARYASPSALPVFGRIDLVGTSLYRLIAGTDQYGQGYLFSKPVTPEEFLFAAQGTRGLS